ncbi:Hypothetical protein A7982_03397 [Minicystis rosea]|nr:Hypothetical protein A7982_03397 [Minicystis rosea]
MFDSGPIHGDNPRVPTHLERGRCPRASRRRAPRERSEG